MATKKDNGFIDLEDLQKLEYTQEIRKKGIALLMENGLPTKMGETTLLTSLLDGMDRTVLAKGRLKASEKAVSDGTEVKEMMGEFLRSMAKAKSMSRNVSTPQLSSDVPELILVPGETEIVSDGMDYKTFTSKNKKT